MFLELKKQISSLFEFTISVKLFEKAVYNPKFGTQTTTKALYFPRKYRKFLDTFSSAQDLDQLSKVSSEGFWPQLSSVEIQKNLQRY